MASQENQNCVVSYSQPHKRTKHSSMPDDVIEKILSFLSFKEICRLSILSKRFRFSWKFCRNLTFDKNFASNLSKDEYKFIVTNFFANHSLTCADTCKLCYDATNDASLVSNWIDRAITLQIKEFELDFSPSKKKFMLNYNLINIKSIKMIKLINCELHLPINSNGPCYLSEITLQDVRARPEMIRGVLENCVALKVFNLIRCNFIFTLNVSTQVLQTLVVKNCSGVDSIAINAPSLRMFYYYGKFTEFNFYCDLPYLNEVVLDIAQPRSFQLLSHRKDVVNSLAFVHTLTVSSSFLEGLSIRFKDYAYKDMDFSLWKLREFHLIVAPDSFLNPSDVAIFLMKCPYIERVFINLRNNAFGESLYWNNYGRKYLSECEIIFPFLKKVTIKGFTMKELSVSMARYFLKNAICLQRLVLVKARTHHFPDFYNSDCLRLGIISNAIIEILDH